MDIGVPFRDLGLIDVSECAAHLAALSEDAWHRNPLRQEVLAGRGHSVADSILFKHEWDPNYQVSYWHTLEDLVKEWARLKNIDAEPYMPISREETDLGYIYTFNEWREYEPLIAPIVDRAIAPVRTANGVITRLALVRLGPGAKIQPHEDGQILAERAHRIHVAIVAPPGVTYKIGGKKLLMRAGHAYDFNNRLRHSVTHRGKHPRINLFIDYYADPGVKYRDPLSAM